MTKLATAWLAYRYLSLTLYDSAIQVYDSSTLTYDEVTPFKTPTVWAAN